MGIFRVEKTRDYTVMANHHLRNENLSLKSKGLLSQMLSLPENWDYTLKGLSMINQESIDCIREAVRELERAGYIQRIRERNDKGHLKGTDYTIFERPQVEPNGGSIDIPHGQKNGSQSSGQRVQEPINEAAVATKRDSPMSDTAGRQNIPNNASRPVSPTRDYPRLENPTLDNPTQANPTQENPTLGKPILDNPTQANPTQDCPTLENPTQLSTYPSRKESSSTEPTKTETRNPHPSNPSPIHLSNSRYESDQHNGWDGNGYEDIDSLRALIHRNIEYPFISQRYSREQVDEIVDIIVETLCSRKTIITVAADDYPVALVKDKLLRLNSSHIEYVLDCMSQNTTIIRNIRKYLLAALFNASSTIDSYYSAMVRHDQSRDASLR